MHGHEERFARAVRCSKLWPATLLRPAHAQHMNSKVNVAACPDQCAQVIKSGKLPLLELEAEGLTAIKGYSKPIEVLSIFLTPPSEEVFKQRVVEWLTESDEEIRARMVAAQKEVGGRAARNADVRF